MRLSVPWRRALLCSVLTLATALLAAPAGATILTRCGASEGLSYFLQGPAVSPGQTGWQPDRLSGGGVILIADPSGVDLVFTDAVGTRSARADGATVLPLQGAEGKLLVLVVYPSTATAESYVFDLDSAGRGSVIWTSSRAGGPIQRVVAMSARCSGP